MSELLMGLNLNPPGAPYQGATNNSQLDTLPREIVGFVHATQNVTFKDRALIRGMLLTDGAVTVSAAGSIVYNDDIQVDLPEGYVAQGPLRPVAGSWRRVGALP